MRKKLTTLFILIFCSAALADSKIFETPMKVIIKNGSFDVETEYKTWGYECNQSVTYEQDVVLVREVNVTNVYGCGSEMNNMTLICNDLLSKMADLYKDSSNYYKLYVNCTNTLVSRTNDCSDISNEDLDDCETERDDCKNDLVSCNSEKEREDADLSRCNNELQACENDNSELEEGKWVGRGISFLLGALALYLAIRQGIYKPKPASPRDPSNEQF